jgi:hypothetical protein
MTLYRDDVSSKIHFTVAVHLEHRNTETLSTYSDIALHAMVLPRYSHVQLTSTVLYLSDFGRTA